jgi:hypothetical protein
MTPLTTAMLERPDEEPVPDQACWVENRPENLHAVLSLTAVIGPAELADGDRRLVKLEAVEVDLSELAWQPRQVARIIGWNIPRKAADRGRARGNKAQRERAAGRTSPTGSDRLPAKGSVMCRCGCGHFTRPGEVYASVKCARRAAEAKG